MNHMTILKGMNKKALAGYTMPKGLGDALKPAPTAMKIDKPQQAAGNQMMDQAAAAEGVSTSAGNQDPVAALTTSLDKITAVAKGLVPKAAPAAAPTAQPDPNPAQVAQQQNQIIPQPGNPKLASVSKGKLLLYKLIKG